MSSKSLLGTLSLLAASIGLAPSARAAVPPLLSLQISNESGPPGSIVQVKVFVTEPTPISTGFMQMAFDTSFIGGIEGIAAFSTAGEVWGTAVERAGALQLWLHSPQAVWGLNPDYPILAIAVKIRADARPGSSTPVTFGGATVWVNASGAAYPAEVNPGSITVGGKLSIGNVIPGSGPVAAGTPVRITGTGFGPETKFAVGETKVTSVTIAGPAEALLTLRDTVPMDGRRIRAVNPGAPGTTYFSYLRPASAGLSSDPLLASTVPLFSAAQLGSGSFALPCANATLVCGIALLNAGSQPVAVALTLTGPAGAALGSANLTIASGTRLVRTVREVFGRNAPLGSTVRLSAPAPLHMMGLVADSLSGAVRPLPVSAGP